METKIQIGHLNGESRVVNWNPTRTHEFESSCTKCIYSLIPQNLYCASKNVIYLLVVKKTGQYTGSTEEFRSRFDNCR